MLTTIALAIALSTPQGNIFIASQPRLPVDDRRFIIRKGADPFVELPPTWWQHACVIRTTRDGKYLIRATTADASLADGALRVWKINATDGSVRQFDVTLPKDDYGTYVTSHGPTLAVYCMDTKEAWSRSEEPFTDGWTPASELPADLSAAVIEWRKRDKWHWIPPIFSDFTISTSQSYTSVHLGVEVPVFSKDRIAGWVSFADETGSDELVTSHGSISFPGGRRMIDLNVVDGQFYMSSELPFGTLSGVSEPAVPEYRGRVFRLSGSGSSARWQLVGEGYSFAGSY